jgi:hypothetical protein
VGDDREGESEPKQKKQRKDLKREWFKAEDEVYLKVLSLPSSLILSFPSTIILNYVSCIDKFH